MESESFFFYDNAAVKKNCRRRYNNTNNGKKKIRYIKTAKHYGKRSGKSGGYEGNYRTQNKIFREKAYLIVSKAEIFTYCNAKHKRQKTGCQNRESALSRHDGRGGKSRISPGGVGSRSRSKCQAQRTNAGDHSSTSDEPGYAKDPNASEDRRDLFGAVV